MATDTPPPEHRMKPKGHDVVLEDAADVWLRRSSRKKRRAAPTQQDGWRPRKKRRRRR